MITSADACRAALDTWLRAPPGARGDAYRTLISTLGSHLRAVRADERDDGRMADYAITCVSYHINDCVQWATPSGRMPVRGWSNVAPAIVEITAAYGLHLDHQAVWDWLKWRRAVVRREGACDLVMYLPQHEGAAPEHVVVSIAHGGAVD